MEPSSSNLGILVWDLRAPLWPLGASLGHLGANFGPERTIGARKGEKAKVTANNKLIQFVVPMGLPREVSSASLRHLGSPVDCLEEVLGYFGAILGLGPSWGHLRAVSCYSWSDFFPVESAATSDPRSCPQLLQWIPMEAASRARGIRQREKHPVRLWPMGRRSGVFSQALFHFR